MSHHHDHDHDHDHHGPGHRARSGISRRSFLIRSSETALVTAMRCRMRSRPARLLTWMVWPVLAIICRTTLLPTASAQL